MFMVKKRMVKICLWLEHLSVEFEGSTDGGSFKNTKRISRAAKVGFGSGLKEPVPTKRSSMLPKETRWRREDRVGLQMNTPFTGGSSIVM